MLTKVLPLFFLLLSSPSWALLEYSKGTCELDGRLYQAANKNWYFLVNPEANNETRFLLKDFKSTELRTQGENVKVQLVLSKPVVSQEAEVVLKKIVKKLNPYRELKFYHSYEVKKLCK